MKASIKSILLPTAACVVLFAACGSNAESDVRAVAESYVNAESPSAACDLLHPSYRSEIENYHPSGECVDGVSQYGAGDETAQIGAVEIEGDHASVEVSGSSGLGDLGYKGKIQLIRREDSWKIIELDLDTIGGQ